MSAMLRQVLPESAAMPRRRRLEIPGVPMHITHRGVNRAAVFLDDQDFGDYATSLRHCFEIHHVNLHAYVFMTNHVHLLASSPETGAVSRALSRHGQRYVPAFNRRHGRTGTLWEGRFKSCLVESTSYLLTLYRYIELNPVRAAIVDRPDAYRWSSVHANLGYVDDPLVTPHAVFVAFARESGAYRSWLARSVSDDELTAIRRYIGQERALGSERFQRMVAEALRRPVTVRARGRPTTRGEERFKR